VAVIISLVFATGSKAGNYQEARRAVTAVFGSYASQAMSVANCETGGTFSVWAGYGKHDYWGLFQMGYGERRTYGHGWNPWAQARAAYRYFVASGRDWSPWTCKPW
jgi:hypothetical protein